MKISFREKLFNESPFCRRCNVLMVMNNSRANNSCTIQHNKPKGHIEYNIDKTIWCHKCNQEDNNYKVLNKIFSLNIFIQQYLNIRHQLNGKFLIDDYVYQYKKSKLVKKIHIIDYKINILSRYMYLIIDAKIVNQSFEDYFDNTIQAKCNFKQYAIGDGWYKLKSKSEGLQLSLNL